MAVLKWIGLGLLGLVVVIAAGIGIAAAVFDWNDARGFIARQATKALNREVAIDGDLKVKLGDPIHIHVEGVRVANADWSDEKTMAALKVLDAQLRLWPLLRGNYEFPEIRLSAPKLVLEKNKDGEPNWNFGGPDPRKTAAKEAVKPESRSDIPIIEALAIEEGRVRYRDPTSRIDIDSGINTATGGNGEAQVHLDGNGNFAGKPFTLLVEGGSLQYLRDNPKPYPLKVETAVGKTKGKIEGSIAEPVKLEGVDLSVALSGDDLADVFPILGIPTPKTRPYSLTGHLGREGQVWRFDGMKGKVGESDLSGTVAVDLGGERPKVTGDLVSKKLAAVDMAGFVGASPEGKGSYPTKGPDRILPDTPVPLDKLRKADMDVSFKGDHVEAPFSTLDDLKAHLKLENGKLTVDPLALGVGGGRIAGTTVLDGSQKVPTLRSNLEVRQIKLAQLFRETRFAKEMGGTASGRIQLTGRGATVADILGSSDGKLGVAVDGGRITSYAVKGLKTNILETLGVALSGDQPLPFNCLVANLSVDKGVVNSEALVLDTPETVVTADGTINLRTEALDMRILGRAKKPQIFATHVPVRVTGTLGEPDIGVNPTESAARGAAAVALGALLTPLASVLPFLDPGSHEQPHCGQLIQDARSPSKTNGSAGSSGNGKNGAGSGKSQ
ncbi:AsmA family protein [Azospirillum sp. sgz302134]